MLEECNWNVEKAIAASSKEETEVPAAASGGEARHASVARASIGSNPSHIRRHRKGDIDDTDAAFHPSSAEPSPASSVAANPPRTTRSPRPIAPGAVAVAGAHASRYDADEYTVSAQAQVHQSSRPQVTALKSTVNKEPVTARVVQDTEQDVELLQDQIQEQNERLAQLERERENAVVAQVIVGDEEAQDTNNDEEASPAAKSSMFSGKRKKWFILIAILAVIGIVVGIVVGVTSSPPTDDTTYTAATAAGTCNDQTAALSALDDPNLSLESPEVSDDTCVANGSLIICDWDFGAANPGFQQACLNNGGQYLPIDTEVSCTLTSDPSFSVMLDLQDVPICLGRACDLNLLDDDLEEEIKTGFIQALESSGTLDCESPSTLPPVPAPAPTPTPTGTGPTTCVEQTNTLLEDPTLAVNVHELSVADDCVTVGSVLDCEYELGEGNEGFQQACLGAGGQYFPVDITQVSCTLTNDQSVTILLDVRDLPTCLGQACGQNDIDAVEREIENGFIQGLESDGSLDCTSAGGS